MQVLKLYAWETYFEKKIESIRNEELIVLQKSAVIGTASYIFGFSSNFLVRINLHIVLLNYLVYNNLYTVELSR